MLALPFDLLIPLAHPLRLQAEHNRVQESSTGISWDQLVLSAMQCQAHFLPFSRYAISSTENRSTENRSTEIPVNASY
jgi:hypothetical protein